MNYLELEKQFYTHLMEIGKGHEVRNSVYGASVCIGKDTVVSPKYLVELVKNCGGNGELK